MRRCECAYDLIESGCEGRRESLCVYIDIHYIHTHYIYICVCRSNYVLLVGVLFICVCVYIYVVYVCDIYICVIYTYVCVCVCVCVCVGQTIVLLACRYLRTMDWDTEHALLVRMPTPARTPHTHIHT